MLLVIADPALRQDLQIALAGRGYAAVAADRQAAAVRELAATPYAIVLCDGGAPDLIRELALAGGPSVVAVIAAGDDATADAALEAGAYDVVLAPARWERLAPALRRAEERARLLADNRRLAARQRPPTAEPATDERVGGMVGGSDAIRAVFKQVRQVARHSTNVLITGESGTGKELVARAIHDLGPRASRPFVAVNCGAIPAPLLESELFGHRKGAFTDAVRDKRGLFEEADGGTLFLDEIGELPLALQVKLLRALQESEVRRIGDNRPTPVDVRIVAATVRNLPQEVARGGFREDLFYRLNVMPLWLPPLRDRRADVRPLVHHFVRSFATKHGASARAVGVSEDALALLEAYTWPGNIRELENTIERAMVLCEDGEIGPALLEDKLRGPKPRVVPAAPVDGELSIKKTTRALERDLIARALETTGGNRTNAAKLLEISHRALLYKIKEYGL